MIQPNQQKRVVEITNNCKEAVLFNSDTLSKIISFLPSVDLLSLALTCTRFGIHTNKEEVLFGTDTLPKIISYLPSVDLLNLAQTSTRFSVSNTNDDSIIEESTRIAIRDIATEEQLATLPYYNGENSLAQYHHLQFIREPLSFDQLVDAEYVNIGDKSCVTQTDVQRVYNLPRGTAFSDNILRAGKHYATFRIVNRYVYTGVMRPGEANQNAEGLPTSHEFYQNFSQRLGGEYNYNSVQCCLYNPRTGGCYSSGYRDPKKEVAERWDYGSKTMSSGDEIGMLLDLDVGTLSVYKNGRNLGVMMRGLAGPYCWVVSMSRHNQVSMRRGTIPPEL